MPKTTITGASDDLIELDGQITEEMNPPGEEPSLLAFSDGTLLRIVYDDDGIWRITRLMEGTCSFSLVPGSVENDTNDIATLDGDLRWCAIGEEGQYNPITVKLPKVGSTRELIEIIRDRITTGGGYGHIQGEEFDRLMKAVDKRR